MMIPDDFEYNGVMVSKTDLSQFKTEAGLYAWVLSVETEFTRINANGSVSLDECFYQFRDALKKFTEPRKLEIREEAEARKMAMPPRNLELVVEPQNGEKRNYGFVGMKAIQVLPLLDAFDTAGQMTSYEFDAYATLGDEECERQTIETLHDLFGTDFAEAFYRRKNVLLANLELRTLYGERNMLLKRIERLERQAQTGVVE